MTDPEPVRERELTAPVSLTAPNGRLNTDAIGFARSPLVDTSGIGAGRGRNKRWEYWNVTTPTHIVALTISSIDYAAVHEVWIFDRATQREWGKKATVIPPQGVELPPSLGVSPALARAKDLAITVTPNADDRQWRLFAEIPGASFDITVTRADGHDCLAVVVPWSTRRFQYTVKSVALPARGSLTLDGEHVDVPHGSWAVLDHGRGRWPYNARWNWGAGAGVAGDHVIGLQVGGQWTDGTGSTENGVVVDGILHKISVPLSWEYDLAQPLRPWRVHGGGLDMTLTPVFDKRSKTNFGIVAGRTDQCFGTWSGSFDGLSFEGIDGFAEDVHNRW